MIALGDEVEDITSKLTGIIIARIKYLDGSMAFLVQPQMSNNDGSKSPVFEVSSSYVKKIGEGVRVEEKNPIGFVC